MLLLGVGDPTQGRTEVDPDPLRRRGATQARDHPGVVEGKLSGDQAELAEPVELAGRLRRHPGQRVEVVDLRRDLAPERRRIEPVDPLDRRPCGPQARPEGVAPGPDRGDDPDARDPDPPTVGHVEGFVDGSGSDWFAATASAIDLNVASVRPAIGE